MATHSSSETVRSAIFMLTSACNLRCDYCFEVNHSTGTMNRETAFQSLQWLFSSCGDTVNVVLFGGEPLLCEQLIPWFLEVSRSEAEKAGKRIVFSITTNGTLFNETWSKLFKKYRVSIRLSADGEAKGHDVHRKYIDNRSSFHDVEQAIPLIREVCPQPSIRMTVTPKNVHEMVSGVMFFVNQGFDTVLPVPLQEAQWAPSEFKAYAMGLEHIASHLILELLGGRFLTIYGITDVLKRLMVPSKRYPCGAGRSMIAIDVDGSIFPCQRFIGYSSSDRAFRLGHVSPELDHTSISRFRQITLNDMQGCQDAGDCHACSHFEACGGGCMAINILTSGSPTKPLLAYQKFKDITVQVTHTVITYLENHYPRILQAYVGKLFRITT